MDDLWQKARSFAGEAAKRSQELTIGGSSKLSGIVSEASKRSKEIAVEASKRSKEIAAEASKRSQDITIGSSKLSDIVSETAKRSKEIAAEASKRADQIRHEAIRRADLQIRSLSGAVSRTENGDQQQQQQQQPQQDEEELEKFGVTEELREFVKEITMSTFQDFPLQDDSEMSNVLTVSNVSQDLTEWQAKHASLVLSSVKEISKLRYELCPRFMKERKFWRIYFILINNHIAPYEKRYMEEAKQKPVEQVKEDKLEEPAIVEITSSKPEAKAANQPTKKSSSVEQDLDVFLLGGDSDDGRDDNDDKASFDDDFDEMVNSSDDEKGKVKS